MCLAKDIPVSSVSQDIRVVSAIPVQLSGSGDPLLTKATNDRSQSYVKVQNGHVLARFMRRTPEFRKRLGEQRCSSLVFSRASQEVREAPLEREV